MPNTAYCICTSLGSQVNIVSLRVVTLILIDYFIYSTPGLWSVRSIFMMLRVHLIRAVREISAWFVTPPDLLIAHPGI